MDKRKILREFAETIVKVADIVPDEDLEKFDMETLIQFIGITALLKEILKEEESSWFLIPFIL